MNWMEKAEDEISQQYTDGEITLKEFNEQMRDLMSEIRAEAEQAADEARNNYYNQ